MSHRPIPPSKALAPDQSFPERLVKCGSQLAYTYRPEARLESVTFLMKLALSISDEEAVQIYIATIYTCFIHLSSGRHGYISNNEWILVDAKNT